MARTPKTPLDVAALKHEAATRKNIPTAEFESIMAEADKTPIQVAYDRRNRDLDPQLVWRGKDAQDWSDLIVSAPPLYIQEKVHPKVLIDDLKRETQARAGAAAADAADAGTPDLFADFNGLPDVEAVTEFYQHDAHWANRMIAGDSLSVMASLAEREGLRGRVQCIYFDPPYGIKFNSNFQWSTTSRDVKDGSKDHITREPEQVRAFRDTWKDGIHSYLTYLRDRLTVARDLLHDSGSIFVQIGDENVHRVRALMDEIFGEENLVSQINFKSMGALGQGDIPNVYDYLIWYSKNKKAMKFRKVFRMQDFEADPEYRYKQDFGKPDFIGESTSSDRRERNGIFRRSTLTSSGFTPSCTFDFPLHGGIFKPFGRKSWRTNSDGMNRLLRADRLFLLGSNPYLKRYATDSMAILFDNSWSDAPAASERIYVVQTADKFIERCILMTTDPGDLVLDPTCGSGTTAYVAEQWGRRWITVDTSRVAIALARSRLMGARYPYYLLADSPEGQQKEAELTRTAPKTLPTHGDIRHGFVYERVPHITLKSIANNAEIDAIWDRRQPAVEAARADLNAALAGHAAAFPVTTGGRAGQTIDFTAAGEVTLPSGEAAPANGFMEWEVPRDPGTPWPADQSKLHAKALAGDTAALAKLNAARGEGWTVGTLPADPATPWPQPAVDALARFWEARIARQREIDASIEAKADSEYLYDKPYVDKGKVRVAGPFTVESLSPHRTLAVDWDDELVDVLAASEGKHAGPAGGEGADFAAMILENLKTAGVQQAHKEDRITFTSLTGWPGRFICAEGTFVEGGTAADDEDAGDGAAADAPSHGAASGQPGGGTLRRAGIFIGPEFGTVSRPDLVAAAREAGDAGFDLLIACAFNYDAHSAEFDSLGRVPVLKARMNPDLHMGQDLKSTGAGNLFVVFGEPDIQIEEAGQDAEGTDLIRVKVFGVDVFKPQTGEVVSEGTDGIALWMLDTDYNEESFFVRHAYFLGANDPYKALKTTLKAEIDAEAWESLHGDTSRPFPKPTSGRIAVKVINHLGDEVMKVFSV